MGGGGGGGGDSTYTTRDSTYTTGRVAVNECLSHFDNKSFP